MRRLGALALMIGLLWPAAIHAVAPGIAITPPLQKLIVTTEPQKSFSLGVTNNTGLEQKLAITTVDFGALDETGGLLFVGENSDFEKKYGLAHWLKLDQDQLDLQPGQSASVVVTVINDSTLAPGGHYGALLLRDARDLNKPSGTKVDLKSVVSSLIFLQKLGGEKYDMHLERISHNGGLLRMPSSVSVNFKNRGNVHVVPRGIVTLKDMRGKVVAKGVINIESSLILPEANRNFAVPLQKLAQASVPGNYTITVDYRYDGFDQFASKDFHFLFVNIPLVGVSVLIIVLMVVAGIVALRRRK